MLVRRPNCLHSVSTEDEWLHEADASRQQIDIDRVVSSMKWTNPKTLRRVKNISDVGRDGFWPEMAPSRCPETIVEKQMAVLSPITTHSAFIAFASAHLDGSSKDLEFVIEMVKQARGRKPGYASFDQLDLHTEGTVEENLRELRLQRVYNKIKDVLKAPLPRVRLFFWHKLVERVLLAGDVSAGPESPNIRWVTAMTHVVRPNSDPPDGDAPTWTVLPPKPATKWVNRFYSATVKPFPNSPYVFPPVT
jgi:hypothetical protein